MASSKRIGFFWGEEKITLIEFEKNSPLQVISSALGAKTGLTSPFSSNLTEEIQITVLLKKLLEDHRITAGAFYVSLPMREIILRSFVIPFVKPDDIQNAVKFESKKYIPFDIQDLAYVFYTIPFLEGQNKRLQVIFFAARKEVLSRYERIFKQLNMPVIYAEPYMVSLAKALLFRKEILPTDHIAFLILDKNLGRICFIDKGIPQFIREFPVGPIANEEGDASAAALSLKIVNEVLNSFDFYSRQFSGDRIDRILVSCDFVQKDLSASLEAELKLKIIKFSPTINTSSGPSSDMEAIYAMGACVAPPIESFSKFNFISEKAPSGTENQLTAALKPYGDIILTFLMCVFFLLGVHVFFQMQSKLVQNQYDRISAQEGADLSQSTDSIQAQLQQNTDQLDQYKNIRTKSEVSAIILRLASHLPVGTMLTSLKIAYDQGGASGMSIDMEGMVVTGDFTSQIAVVNRMFADFKNDKKLSQFIKSVSLVSLNRTVYNDHQATAFDIHFS